MTEPLPFGDRTGQAADQIGYQFRLIDSFGDNGMICVVVIEVRDDTVEIDTWLMSCRVLERGVEQAVLNEILRVAAAVGARSVLGRYVPTERNSMVRDHYQRLGFAPAPRPAPATMRHGGKSMLLISSPASCK
jgi:FkbH-like protein